MKTIIIKLIGLAVAGLLFTSCNTVQGIGKDFQSVGSGLQRSSQGGLWKNQAPVYQQPVYPNATYTPPL